MEALSHLTGLTVYEYAQHQLTKIPAGLIRSWQRLEVLDVRHAQVLVDFPWEELAELPRLTEVILFGSAACISIPPALAAEGLVHCHNATAPVCPPLYGLDGVAEEEKYMATRAGNATTCGEPVCTLECIISPPAVSHVF